MTSPAATTWSNSELRRSINHLALRWQARLEGNGPDRAIPWVLALLLFIGLGALSLARYRSLQVGEQLAAWMQGTWLITQGEDTFVTLTERDLFDGQFSLIMWPIAQLSNVIPAGPLLLVLQSLALALGVVPLWRIARSVLELGVETALVLGLAYGFQPQLHNVNLSEFHPEALAVPALLWAYYFSQEKEWIRFAFAVTFALLTRSDLGLVVIGLGALLAVEGRTRAGRLTAAFGAIWALLALGVFRSDLAGGEFVYGDAFESYGDGPVSILWGMLTNPVQVLGDFFAEENFRKLILLFAPWLFLPVLRLRFQLPLIIFGIFGFLADIPPGEFGNPQQDVAALAFLPIASAFALRAVGRRSVRRVFVNGRLLGGVLFASMAFFLFGAGSSLYNEPWTWGSRSSNDLDVIAAVETVQPDDSVAAIERALPLLADRIELLRFPDGLEIYKPAEPTFGVDVILIDESDESWTTLGRATFDQVIEAKGYEVENRFGTVSVYRLETIE